MPEKTRRRTARQPAERWLFAHPSWLNWWFLKNAEANPELAKLITGVFCVFVESESGRDSVKHYKAMKRRCEALRWSFVPGLRFSHQGRGPKEWGRLMDPKEHKAIIRKAARWPSLMLDMEPYGIKKGRRYHSSSEAYALFKAAEPWQDFNKQLFVYPPQFQSPESILMQCQRGMPYSNRFGWPNALDHSTYNAGKFGPDLTNALRLRFDYYWGRRLEYHPGFYLRYIQDRRVMGLATKYRRCWFFPSSTDDDRRHFMTPEWAPKEIKQ